jgi:hypothetical protein
MKLIMTSIAVLFCLKVSAFAQWSDVPDMNLAICSAGGEQAITKIVATDDGGCFVSWFDNRSSGYDVYMQRLSPEGIPLWQADGVLIAERNYSWTMDFDLTLDSVGNAVVAYRQNMLGGDGVVVSSVSPKGVVRWSKTVQGAGSFVASPVVTASGADVVAGWSSENVSNFQRLDVSGNFLWNDPPSVDDPQGGTLQVSDLHPSLGGSVIASFVQYTTFSGPKKLLAQQLNSNGIEVWLQLSNLMENNSLQYGAYPEFISDENGGAFFTWYGTSPLQCFATHVNSNGDIWESGQVQVASGFGSTQSVNPTAVVDGDSFVVFFRTLDSSQNNDGVSAQRFSADGNRLWGAGGITIEPISSSPQYGSFAAGITGEGAILCFGEAPSWGLDVINATCLNVKGASVWSPTIVAISSTPSSISRIALDTTGDGIVLAWQDDRSGANDIYGQRVNADGTLGNSETSCTGDINGDSTVGVGDLLIVIDAWGECGLVCDADIDGDGLVGVSDLLVLIDGWGTCS